MRASSWLTRSRNGRTSSLMPSMQSLLKNSRGLCPSYTEENVPGQRSCQLEEILAKSKQTPDNQTRPYLFPKEEDCIMRILWDRPALLAGLVTMLTGLAWMTSSSMAGGTKPKEGDPAPEIELPAAQIDKALPDQKDAKTMKLQAFKGKKNVVLFFFPKAFTKG